MSLQSDNNSASMSVNILTAHAQSIVGTYIFGDRTTAAQITYVFMNYRGIYYSMYEEDPAFHIVDGVMTISKNENDEFVVQFELRTEAGEVLTGVSTIANYYGFSDSKVTSILHRTRKKLRAVLEKEDLL